MLLNKLKEFLEKLKDFFLKTSRFRQLELVTIAEKRPKKSLLNCVFVESILAFIDPWEGRTLFLPPGLLPDKDK